MEDWTVRDGVYAPREDSRLMAEVLEDRDFAGKTVLDIGTGSGILAYTALRQGADAVTAVDINPDALDNTRENLTAHGIDSDRFTLLRSDLFNAIEELFDVILFNPPYVPGEGELKTMEEQSWAGGEQGREVTDRFLDMYTDYLADDGDVFLLQSSRNDIEQTLDRFQEQGCEAAVVAEEKVPWEKLVVIRATLQ